jgi:hypothetical protein
MTAGSTIPPEITAKAEKIKRLFSVAAKGKPEEPRPDLLCLKDVAPRPARTTGAIFYPCTDWRDM